MGRGINSIIARQWRESLSEAQNHRCAFRGCDVREGATLAHVVPRVCGGRWTKDNLVVACFRCNQECGPRNAFVFFNLLQDAA